MLCGAIVKSPWSTEEDWTVSIHSFLCSSSCRESCCLIRLKFLAVCRKCKPCPLTSRLFLKRYLFCDDGAWRLFLLPLFSWTSASDGHQSTSDSSNVRQGQAAWNSQTATAQLHQKLPVLPTIALSRLNGPEHVFVREHSPTMAFSSWGTKVAKRRLFEWKKAAFKSRKTWIQHLFNTRRSSVRAVALPTNSREACWSHLTEKLSF